MSRIKSYIPSLSGSYKVSGCKPNWHFREIADKLNDVINGKIKRIMFLVPPRHGKTELVSRRMPNCFLEANPDKKVLLVSYDKEIAQALAVNVQENFRDRFRALGVGEIVPAIDFDIILIDDPIKNYQEAISKISQNNLWEWYKSLETNLKSNGAIVLIMNRWCKNDFAGRLLKEEPNQWEVLSFPALYYKKNDFDPRAIGEPLWLKQVDLKKLQFIRSNDPILFEALFQQCPLRL